MNRSIYNLCHGAVVTLCFVLGELAFLYGSVVRHLEAGNVLIWIQDSLLIVALLLLLAVSGIYLPMIALLKNSTKLWNRTTAPVHQKSFVMLRETVLAYLQEEDHDPQDFLKWVRIAWIVSVVVTVIFIGYVWLLPL